MTLSHSASVTSHSPTHTVRAALLNRAVAYDLAGQPEHAIVATRIATWVSSGDVPDLDTSQVYAFADYLVGDGHGALADVVRQAGEAIQGARCAPAP